MEWTIKQVVEVTGISADTLRYYEKKGFVSPKRHGNGYRYYDKADIAILKNIIVMKYAHFTLSEIKSMEELFHKEAGVECNEICKSILNSKITELKHAIRNYQKIIRLMENLLPMIDSADSYQKNEKEIDGFISRIFDDIQKEKLFAADILSKSNRNEGQ